MPILPTKYAIIESPPLARLEPDSFFRQFVELNHLAQVSHFLFLPGMLFNDTGQWWRAKGMRPRPHEGIDIYLMQDMETGVTNVRPQMLIPAILPGYLVHFHRDFLGETLYIRHPEMRREDAVLHTLYGHLQFIADRSCPAFIDKGQRVGVISPSARSAVPAHLHLSYAWIREGQRIEELSWETMSTGSNVVFIDPLPFLLQ